MNEIKTGIEEQNNNDRKNNEPKQIIVINKSLNMSSSKMAAQVSHASLGCLLKSFEIKESENGNAVIHAEFDFDSALILWLKKRFTKVVLYVKSEEKLLEVYKKVQDAGLVSVLIQDAGFTFFDKPTYTCVGIGPDFPEKMEPVVGKLQVLKD